MRAREMTGFFLCFVLHKKVRKKYRKRQRARNSQSWREFKRKLKRDESEEWSSVACLRGQSEMLSNTMEQVLHGIRFR